LTNRAKHQALEDIGSPVSVEKRGLN